MMICINKNDDEYRFFTGENRKFMFRSPDGKDSILLHDVSDEYDGVCTSDGSFHFLIQSVAGELIYLRSEENIWKKYSIFKNKDNECRVKNIRLTFSENMLCAFYAIDHAGKIMLCKHIFSAEKLYMTPEIADLTDERRDFSICTDDKTNTLLSYRDIGGQWQEIVYDRNFQRISQSKRASGGEIYSLSKVNSGKRTDSVYMSVKKSYTALMYAGEDERKEKIITFGISKNTKPMIYAEGDEITIIWQDGRNTFRAQSKDGGESFSKPVTVNKKAEFVKIRKSGTKPGVFYSDQYIVSDYEHSGKIPVMAERRNNSMETTNRYGREIADRNATELSMHLGKLQKEIERINFGLDRVCSFLEMLTEFKNKNVKENTDEFITSTDIGEKNEENIRLFESMTIDEALPDNDEPMAAFEE